MKNIFHTQNILGNKYIYDGGLDNVSEAQSSSEPNTNTMDEPNNDDNSEADSYYTQKNIEQAIKEAKTPTEQSRLAIEGIEKLVGDTSLSADHIMKASSDREATKQLAYPEYERSKKVMEQFATDAFNTSVVDWYEAITGRTGKERDIIKKGKDLVFKLHIGYKILRNQDIIQTLFSHIKSNSFMKDKISNNIEKETKSIDRDIKNQSHGILKFIAESIKPMMISDPIQKFLRGEVSLESISKLSGAAQIQNAAIQNDANKSTSESLDISVINGSDIADKLKNTEPSDLNYCGYVIEALQCVVYSAAQHLALMDEQQAQNTEANIKDNIIKAIQYGNIELVREWANKINLNESQIKSLEGINPFDDAAKITQQVTDIYKVYKSSLLD